MYKPTVWLTPKLSYSINFERMTVRIANVGELPILGYPSNLSFYKDWKMKEARLVIKDGKAFLKVVFEKKPVRVEAKGSVVVDINIGEIVVGKDDTHYVRIPTRLSEVHHLKSLAEGLQRKYPRRWRENKHIRARISHFHAKVKRIMEDFAKKVGKWVVEIAEDFNANVTKLERLTNLIKR
ncbi:Hypothetical protein SSO1521 [Saccharolobus solfataricus P2]|uniref:Transposase n=2 Tax=Saccharolobus solfataricus TaxID=2287 RepID=Q97Y28_SACS2|nr:Hypothetical protein SSO1521 [Saccharolobus solfataricus P2]SAI85201.1 uncharacterised protein [Saccharolobus solfataricus]